MAKQINITTTGTLSSVILNDLGARTFNHPVSSYNLLNEYVLHELVNSLDLQSAIDLGYITIDDENAVLITDLKDSLLSDMTKSVYDNSGNDGVIDNAEALEGNNSAYHLNTDNHTDGTTNKVFTATEKTKLSNISGTNTGDQTSIVGISGTKSQFDTALSDGTFLYVGDIIGNIPTSLSVGTVTANTVGITSDGGTDDVIIPAATVSTAGLLTTAKWGEIVANNAKVSNATHTGDVTGDTVLTIANGVVGDANIAVHTSSKITITNKSLLNSSIVYTDQANTFGAFDNIFRSTNLYLTNPANTFNYQFIGSAITAARSITLPLLTSNDTMVTAAFSQTLTNKTLTSPVINTQISGNVTSGGNITTSNYLIGATATQTITGKTINATNNTITDTSIATGDILKSNGTKFVRFAMGSALQHLRVNAGGTDIEWVTANNGDLLSTNNLSDVANSLTSFNNIKQQGTTAYIGAWESATIAEINAGTDVTKVVSVEGLAGSQLAADVATNNAKVSNATHTGDVTGSTTLTIASNVVSNAKLSQVATATFKGRTTAGTGNVEDLTVAQAKTLLNLSGTNTGDQTITLTGDVTGSGTGSFAATVANNAITNAKAAQMAANTVKSNATGGTANQSDLAMGASTILARLATGNIVAANTTEIRTLLNVSQSTSNQVIINTLSDLPAPSGGKHVLLPNTKYIFAASINIAGNYLEFGDNTSIQGISGFIAQIIYTGTGGALRGVDANVAISNLTIVSSTSGGTAWAFSNAGKTKTAFISEVIVASQNTASSISGYNIQYVETCNFSGVSNGLTFNTGNYLYANKIGYAAGNTGTCINITSGAYISGQINNCTMNLASGVTGINLNSITTFSGTCLISGNIFIGLGTYITGHNAATYYDVEYRGNVGIQNTIASGAAGWSGNVTAYSQSGNGWVVVAGGTSIGDNLFRFSHTSPNRLTYLGKKPIKARISTSLTLDYESGSAYLGRIGIFKNGVLINLSDNAISVYASEEPVSSTTTVDMVQNDYIEISSYKVGTGNRNIKSSYINTQINEVS